MMDKKRLIVSIVEFLNNEVISGAVTGDAAESLEVAVQCLETTYDIKPSDASLLPDKSLVKIFTDAISHSSLPAAAEISEQDRADAEKSKNEGNSFMKDENYNKAIECYDRAIKLDPRNPVYYCNRAAAKNKLENHEGALSDCELAIKLDPTYSKAHGRMGLAYCNLKRYKEARESYKAALLLEPDNESYKTNLARAEEIIGGDSNENPLDIRQMLNNPALMNMVSQIMTDPNVSQMFSNVVSGGNTATAATDSAPQGGLGGIDSFIQVGQRLAQQMQETHPELVDYLRRQMQNPSNQQNDGNQ